MAHKFKFLSWKQFCFLLIKSFILLYWQRLMRDWSHLVTDCFKNLSILQKSWLLCAAEGISQLIYFLTWNNWIEIWIYKWGTKSISSNHNSTWPTLTRQKILVFKWHFQYYLFLVGWTSSVSCKNYLIISLEIWYASHKQILVYYITLCFHTKFWRVL